jgi:hypothetical protein
MKMTSVVKDILFEDGYSSSEEALKDWALFVALSRVEQYRSERECFEERYGMPLEAFENELHADKGFEDFQKEGDLEDWAFACKALSWWEEKLKDIQRV